MPDPTLMPGDAMFGEGRMGGNRPGPELEIGGGVLEIGGGELAPALKPPLGALAYGSNWPTPPVGGPNPLADGVIGTMLV
jgi:hypothetical protein